MLYDRMLSRRALLRSAALCDIADDVNRPVPLAPVTPRGRGTEAKPLRIYPFGVSRNRLEHAIQQLGVHAAIVRDPRFGTRVARECDAIFFIDGLGNFGARMNA